MYLAKKLLERPPVIVAATSSAFYITDAVSHLPFLVDTGASKSIFPVKGKKQRPQDVGIRLVAANGSPITTYGWRSMRVKFDNRLFTWKFLLADVEKPLLGADFLAHYNLLVDVKLKKLMQHKQTQVNTVTNISPSSYQDLIVQYPEVFKGSLDHNPVLPAKHGIFHHIKTSGPPVFSKYRRLPPEKLRAAKNIFAKLERQGICQKAASPYASPLHLVPKPDGDWRPCGDYRRLNMDTEPDHYPLPNITDVTSSLHKAKLFSKLDLLKGYFQVPVSKVDIPKTAIITPFGTFTFNYSCFGLRNAGATFQRLMDTILGDLPFCICYVDDILIFSKSHDEHMQHLKIVLNKLKENGLIVQKSKCEFGLSKVSFLGHSISSKGVEPLPDKVHAVNNFPKPTTIKKLQEYIGMINFYHRFLPNIAQTLSPLYSLLKGKPKSLNWNPQADEAFILSKKILSNATTLNFPDPSARLQLTTDASETAIGAVLNQVVNNNIQPLGFFSKKLQQAERNYSTFDRELLAIYTAVRHFRHHLEGIPFDILTDHKPIVHAFTKISDAWSNRQRRHLSSISEFNCNIKYIPGNKNPVADALSRIEINNILPGIDFNKFITLQLTDPDVQQAHKNTSLHLKHFPLHNTGKMILCDISNGKPRPLVPTAMRRNVFNLIHSLSHPSGRTTAKLLKEKFVWSSISKDAKAWTRACLPCQTSKVSRHTIPQRGTLPQPSRRFANIHVDIVGPLPYSDGSKYIFTIIDRSTRWPEAIPMSDATSSSCTKALLTWIARHGVPEHITSDRGTPFTSQLWSSLTKLMGAVPHTTTAYHPEANGIIERFHRSLKAALMATCNSDQWAYQLPWVLLGLRTTTKDDDPASPSERVYGQPIAVPGEFFPPETNDLALQDLRQKVQQFGPCTTTHRPRALIHFPKTLDTATHAFVRVDRAKPPLTRPYVGPYEILQRRSNSYQLLINGKPDWVAVERIKPAYLDIPDNTKYSRAGRPIQRSI